MKALNFDLLQYRSDLLTSTKNKINFIYDPVRKKNYQFLPEEFVRQLTLHYLHKRLSYPLSLLSVEKQFIWNGLKKRADILVYEKADYPKILIECKSFKIQITNDHFKQAAVYNRHLKVPYLVLTNGKQTFCCYVNLKSQEVEFINEIPSFGESHI